MYTFILRSSTYPSHPNQTGISRSRVLLMSMLNGYTTNIDLIILCSTQYPPGDIRVHKEETRKDKKPNNQLVVRVKDLYILRIQTKYD